MIRKSVSRESGRGRSILFSVGAALLLTTSIGAARADDAQAVIDRAIANVAKLAGPQTTWDGPTSGPALAQGKSIVFLSGDEQNDISHLYGVYMKEAADKIGWQLTVIDGRGSPTSWLAGLNQGIALKPDGIVMFADAASLQDPIKGAVGQGIAVVGIHAAATPGPHPELNLFYNIQQDTVAIGQAEADWVIAHSKGTAKVVVLSHNEYAIAATKSGATRDRLKECKGCQAIDELNRAFNKQPPSGYVQNPYLVTPDNVNAEGGDKNAFFPSNGYKEQYFKLWGVAN